ncbi:MAG: hypothetical protein B5766_00770 [Candidatus Lumbricidophila eiseniae]|uniref:4-O-methyl-glucuronoyl methylesterase-like domain-containing protein n=1 Tax=Candidatus Lumbricidiphila eiseniae TaxID=1969409 RepID=A0A2A6FV00_9MICO|nr:MAG: hypothetical protein B5766_00770 [Candidatus Lumbricidophila eiseniae]
MPGNTANEQSDKRRTEREENLNTNLPPLWSRTNKLDDSRTLDAWIGRERPRIVGLYEDYVFGRTPEGGQLADIRLCATHHRCVGGSASRFDYQLTVAGPRGELKANLLLYVPTVLVESKQPAPLFAGLNFYGNHTVTAEEDHRGSDPPRSSKFSGGSYTEQLPVQEIVRAGFAVATIHCADFEVDAERTGHLGVRGLFCDRQTLERNIDDPTSKQWGTIGAWAWGLSRAMDAFERITLIDNSNVIVWGHSRLGKTALWTAAQDSRFAGVISNNSGCAGASLFSHHSGEDVQQICDNFGYWFSPVFGTFRNRDDSLPVDQHMLLAAIFPASVHVASARADAHADPLGEYLSCVAAAPIALCAVGENEKGLVSPNKKVFSSSGDIPARVSWGGGKFTYRCREGGHSMNAEDWAYFLSAGSDALSARQLSNTNLIDGDTT